MTDRFVNPIIKYTTSTLKTMPGAELYFYTTGTTTPKVTYQDFNGTVPHANPVVALSDGHFPPIFLDGTYRAELKYLGVTQPGWPVDDIGATNDPAPLADWNSGFSYSDGELVTGPDGNRYESLQDNNLNNDPTAPGSLFWGQIFLNGNVDTWQQLDIAARSGSGPKADAESAIRYSIDLPEPTAVSFVRGNADGTYTNRTPTQTKTDLSLDLVNNTPDASKPVSAAQAAAIAASTATVTKASIGLGNVDNTSDANKPLSTADIAALALKANLASPTLTGNPTAPTAPVGDYDTSITNSKFVQDAIDLQTYHKSPAQFAASFFGQRSSNVVMMLGDSNSEGVGAGSIYSQGYMGLAIRALMNAQDKGEATDRGFRYESVLNLSLAGTYNISGNGSLTTGPGGMASARVTLAPGQYVEVANREISSADVFYDSALSSGSLSFQLNGAAAYRTVNISAGTTIKNTYQNPAPSANGYIINGDLYRYTLPTDTVRITAVGGTVVLTGYLFIRTSSTGTLIYASPKQGWGFDDFAQPTVVADRVAHWDAIYPNTTPRLLVICLGTNNMSAAVGKQKTPANYITALEAMRAAYDAASTATTKVYAVMVPPRPNEALPLGTYEDYVAAIVEYCRANGHHCIRTDRSAIGEIVPNYMADTLHYNLAGQDVWGRFFAQSFGIEPLLGIPAPLPNIKNTIAYSAPWASLAGAYARRSSSGQNDFVTLTGKIQSNASGSLAMGAVPANCRPDVNRNVLVWADGLARGLTIAATSGNLTLAAGAVPTEVSLDGITYPLRD